MKISLVLATIDRSCEVERFLYHLKKQNYKNFELIVVDQNSDKKLEPILEPFKACFSIIHIKSCERGASRARNLGMQYINGDIIGFPDDDCWYAENLLEEVYRFFSQDTQWDGICGRAINEKEKTVVVRFSRREGHISRLNVWSRGVTFTMFFRSEVLDNVCCFDEELGVGAGTPWGSGEETDYLIRVVDASFKIFYNPGLTDRKSVV